MKGPDRRRVSDKKRARRALVANAKRLRKESGGKIRLGDAIRAVKAAVGLHLANPDAEV